MDRVVLPPDLVARLVAEQFPQWAHLPVAPVERDGSDNRTFRLGDRMSVRLPSAEAYAGKVAKEHRWLPVLAPHLPLPIPESLAVGVPGCGYPYPWSVRRWLDGERADVARIDDPVRFAGDLADFLVALRRVDATGALAPGAHNFHRGGPLATYDAETRRTIAALSGTIDSGAATALWDAALAAEWRGAPVWVHGDVAASNLLVADGRLCGVIDWGGVAAGDPACDGTMAWTTFDGAARDAFIEQMQFDTATWMRCRGWALWKALITLAEGPDDGVPAALRQGWRHRPRDVIDALLADPRLVAFDAAHIATLAAWATSDLERDWWASIAPDRTVDAALFREWHHDACVRPHVLVEDGEVCAYGELWEDRDLGEAELARLLVAPARRNRGVGQRLVRHLAAAARARGFDEVWLRVHPENSAALSCYRRAGFVRAEADAEARFNAGQPRRYVWMRDGASRKA